MGHAEDLPIQKDVTLDGRLPLDFAPQRPSLPELHIRGPDDYKSTWVQPSHFCSDGGMGLFFEVTPGSSLPGGALLAVYYGRSNVSLQLKYREAQKLFDMSDYTLSTSRYIVDGQNGLAICGAARANDGFDLFNCYFAYNPVKERMELLTKGPIGPGLYEALANYGPPGERSAYWNARRKLLLPFEARQRCLAYYGGFLY
jgi:hypothetical protein